MIFKIIFTGKYKKETAITIFAPIYVTIAMGYFEVQFYNICEVKWGREFQEFILQNWSRFLDDSQTPSDKNNVKPAELLVTLDSINKTIQFILKLSENEVSFWWNETPAGYRWIYITNPLIHNDPFHTLQAIENAAWKILHL